VEKFLTKEVKPEQTSLLFYNFNDYEGMFDSYINTVNYVSVDPAYLSNVNFFVRKIFLDS